MIAAGIAGAILAAGTAHADTLLWYRFDGDGATIENKANPGTMDGTLKSINTWGSLAGLGNTSAKFPTRGDAFPEGTRIIDPATDVIQSDTVKSLSFSGDPDNSGTVFLDKRNNSDFATLEGLSSFTCEVMFKLPNNSEALSSRISKEILFPLVGIGSAITTGQGWSICLRNDNDGNGFYPFVRCQYKKGANATGGTSYDYQITSSPVTQGVWHHLALSVSVVGTTATFQFYLDYTPLAAKSISDFYGINYASDGAFPLLVGANLWRNSKSCCFMGEIAEVRISNTALAVDQLLRPLPEGPVDSDTLVYLPMGDCDWFGSSNGVLNAVPSTSCLPYWTNGTTIAAYPASASDAIGSVVRYGYFSTNVFSDTKSMAFSRALVSGQYAGHVLRVPYENAHLADDSFTMEWFFKTDGQVPSGNGINSYTFLNNSFAKIMINQANGLLLTRLVPAQGNYQDFNSSGRVDDGQWHHYALVYDKDQGAFAAYLDYRKINSKTYQLATATSVEFIFGGQTASVQAFAGNLDDFRITKRALKASEFLTTRSLVSATALFAHFDGDLSTGQDTAYAPNGVGGTLGGGSAPTFVNVSRKIDLNNDGTADYESTKALRLDGGSVVYPHNSLLECRDFTVEWFAKYESIADVSMLLRFGMMSDDGTGTISWALYRSSSNLRFGAYVSPDGSWKNRYRPDYNFATIAGSGIEDGKWHHWALVAETHTNATPANTTFTLYKDYEQVGTNLVFNGENGADGILAFPSTGTTLSIGTGGNAIKGYIDELRFRPGIQPVSSFMRRLPDGFRLFVR